MVEQQLLTDEFEKWRPQLRSFLFRLTASPEDTADLLQEVFVKAFEKRHTFEGRASIKTWIFTIAANTAKDLLRVRKRWPEDAMDQAREVTRQNPHVWGAFRQVQMESAQGNFDLHEHIQFCFTCISKTLPLQQQVALLLKEVVEFKVAEIAEIMGETEGIVKHALHQARSTMQSIFAKRCALINKQGPCHQCSELNGLFNPEADTQRELVKNELVQASTSASQTELFEIRLRIARAIDPYSNSGAELQFCHYKHIRETVDRATPGP